MKPTKQHAQDSLEKNRDTLREQRVREIRARLALGDRNSQDIPVRILERKPFYDHAPGDVVWLLSELDHLEARCKQAEQRGAAKMQAAVIEWARFPKECPHGAEPDYCDMCRWAWERRVGELVGLTLDDVPNALTHERELAEARGRLVEAQIWNKAIEIGAMDDVGRAATLAERARKVKQLEGK